LRGQCGLTGYLKKLSNCPFDKHVIVHDRSSREGCCVCLEGVRPTRSSYCELQGISCLSCCVTMDVRVMVRLVHKLIMVHTYIHRICSYVGLIRLSAWQWPSFSRPHESRVERRKDIPVVCLEDSEVISSSCGLCT